MSSQRLDIGGKEYAAIRKRFQHYPQIDCPTLDDFLRKNPTFLLWPALMTIAMYLTVSSSEWVQNYMAARDMELFGIQAAVQLTVYSILAVFAVHGFIVAYQPQVNKYQIQSEASYEFIADVLATRSVACLLFHLVYMAMPIRPASKNPLEFLIGYVIIQVLVDAWFGGVHFLCHQFPALYKFGHKTHHMNKTPNAFSAYFMESLQSMFQEVVPVVAIVFFCPIPLDVFYFYMYYGVIGSYLEHTGYELGDLEIPLTGGRVKLGHVLTVLSPLGLILGSQSTVMHDWHHEQFYGNYWLSFSYLDRLFGTLKDGSRAENLADSPLAAKLLANAGPKDLEKGTLVPPTTAEPEIADCTHCEGD